MDVTADASRLPIDLEGSLDPAQLPEVTLGKNTIMTTMEHNSPLTIRTGGDRLSPVRGRTMKEYDQQISDLKKENFSLKMRIYYMEERMQQRFGDGQDVFKTNIELQVEIDNLKRELADKQVLVQKAALAMETLTAKYEQGEENIKNRLLADYKKDIVEMREQLDKANQKCEQSYQDVADADNKLQALKQQLDKVRAELAKSCRTNEELSAKVTSAEFGAQTLTGQLRLAEEAKYKLGKENQELLKKLKDIDNELHDVRRQSVRKDRDILNLSKILQDQSHVDSTSILEPIHIQDELEDLKEALGKKNDQVGDLEAGLKVKDDTIENLKKAANNMEGKLKEVEKALESAKHELQQMEERRNEYKKYMGAIAKSIHLKDKELNDQKIKLAEFEEEIKLLQESLKEMEIQKAKEVENLTNQLTEADADNRRLQHQLTEANETTESLVMKLGKREGELAGFQEKLAQAMDALNKSDEAVESLQAQLKAERAEFEHRLRDQAVHFQLSINNKPESNNEMEGLRQQIVDLQKLIAGQNVELLGLARERSELEDLQDRLKEKDTDIELLSSEHKRELTDLEQELHALRSDNHNKDMKIEALDNHKALLEDTIQKMRESWNSVGGINIRDLSFDLLQDIRLLMDLLRREISSLATLQLQLRELDKSEYGGATEVLVTELSSVQRIYKQLEEGVEKNGRLHQVLLNSLRQEQRLSDSPDSNSCQDGGYNLASTNPQAKLKRLSTSLEGRQIDAKAPQSGKKSGTFADHSESSSSESEWEQQHGFMSVAVETCPDLIDRSLQTGTSFTHTDQWAQTSPRNVDEASHDDSSTNTHRFALGQQMQIPGPLENRKLPLVDSDGDVRLYIFGLHNDSMTDDAKEEHLGLRSESLEDYHNFQHGVLFDNHRIDTHSDYSLLNPNDAHQPISLCGKSPLQPTKIHLKTGPNSSSKNNFHEAATANFLDCNKFSNYLSPPSHDISDIDELDGNFYMHPSNTKTGINSSDGTVDNSYISQRLSEPEYEQGSFSNEPMMEISVKKNDSKRNENLASVKPSHVTLSKTNSVELSVIGDADANCPKDLHNVSESENLKRANSLVKKEISGGAEKERLRNRLGKRSRNNSWAEELEKYRVTGSEQGTILQPDNCMQRPDWTPAIHLSIDYSAKNMEAMSPAELRSLVGDMQKNLVRAAALNQDLQEQLETANTTLDELKKADDTNGLETLSKPNVGVRRSRIPKPSSTSSCVIDSPANNSSFITAYTDSPESLLEVSHQSVDKHSRYSEGKNNHVSATTPEMSIIKKGVDNRIEDWNKKLMESSNQVKILQGKLSAAEGSVMHLSKMNAAYLSALKSAGVSVAEIGEADNELSSSLIPKQNYNPDGIDNLFDPDIDGSNIASVADDSMEKVRSHLPNTFIHSTYGTDPATLTAETLSSTSTVASGDLTIGNLESNADSGSGLIVQQAKSDIGVTFSSSETKSNSLIGRNQSDNNNLDAESSWPSNINCSSGVSQLNNKTTSDKSKNQIHSFKSANHLTVLSQNSGKQKFNSYNHFNEQHAKNCNLNEQVNKNGGCEEFNLNGGHCDLSAKNFYNMDEKTPKNNRNLEEQPVKSGYNIDRKSPKNDGSSDEQSDKISSNVSEQISRLTMDASIFDQSGYPDMTYTSLLDSTVVNRLLAHLEGNMSTIKEDAADSSNLSLEQLQMRVEHLERVNLTLREEIGVYEALHRSQGTQASASVGEELGVQTNGIMTEDDLLKQHLIEIRKLRQRLERLDVTKDPEQLLIFQSHTQQRIIHQEKMISNLQQVLVEKEEQWQRSLMELQHKLSREKALLVDKLENAISELQKEIRNQNSTIEAQKRQILDLDSELKLKEQYELHKTDELNKVLRDKSELEEDLLKRDKEFMDIEKNLFKLEMAKENSESECKRLYIEMEEKEKEVDKLRKIIEDSKDSTRTLKETVFQYEKSIQENNFSLQKLKNEKAASEHRLSDKEIQVKKLETEIGILKVELNSLRSELELKAGLEAQVSLLKEELKEKENLKTKYEFQKVGYEAEIDRIMQEKTKLTVMLESKTTERLELKRQIDEFEQKLLGKAALENQIFSLKEEVKTLSRLQERVDDLMTELDSKRSLDADLREKIGTMNRMQSEVGELREKLFKIENSLRQKEEEITKVKIELKERDEKVKKRDKQINHLLAQCKKLDTAFTKQKYMLNEKLESVNSLKKQMHLYEVTLTCASQEEKDSIMKQLLRELIATQGQVEELLSKLEQNSAAMKTPIVILDRFNIDSSSTTTTTTITTSSKHQDISDLFAAAKDELPESDIGKSKVLWDEQGLSTNAQKKASFQSSLTPISTNTLTENHHSYPSSQTTSPSRASKQQQLKYFSDVDHADGLYDEFNVEASDVDKNSRPYSALSLISTNPLSPHRPHFSSQPTTPDRSSNQYLKHSNKKYTIPEGYVPQKYTGADVNKLFALLKLERHEKLRQETSMGLVALSGIEARLNGRMKTYKSKPLSESLDYSTMREASLSCGNMRVCLEEASRLIATAWITELPPVDNQGHFYDPVLVQQNENLKQELAQLRARFDTMELCLREGQGQGMTTSYESRFWESSLYKQLHKTTQDLEQAKENIDASLADLSSPRRYQSFTNARSPYKSPRRRLEDTL